MKKAKREEHRIIYQIFKIILIPIFWLYYRPRVIGKENIPKKGPILVCGNHKHVYDQCLAIMSTRRMVHYMAKKEYFDSKSAWFFKAAGCIPVNRAIHDETAKSRALDILNDGYALGLFPEGTRNKTTAKLLPFKFGAVSMAQKTNATIVPFAITGDYKFWNNHLTIVFGKPFKVKEEDDLAEVNKKFEETISDLLDKGNSQKK